MAAKGRGQGSTSRSAVTGDLVAPANPGVHVPHFQPVFRSEIVDAEFEDIVDGEDEVHPADAGHPPRFDAEGHRLRLFGRDMAVATTTAPPRRSGVFAVVTALLCALSFWICGGHAVFARLQRQGPAEASGVSTAFRIRSNEATAPEVDAAFAAAVPTSNDGR